MNKIVVAKTVLHFTAQMGAGTIVYTLVRANVAPANMIQKITVPVAMFAMGGLVSEKTSFYMDQIVDEIVTTTKQIQKNTIKK